MIFHSIPSRNILKTTPVAGYFSSHKKRQIQPQVQDCVQSLFFPSGKGKSWCNGPAGAVRHSDGGHLDHSHGTRVEIPGAQGKKNTCGLGRRGSPSGCRHGATRQGCTCECCAKICLWQGAYSRYQTPLRAGASPEHPTTRQPPQQGHS